MTEPHQNPNRGNDPGPFDPITALAGAISQLHELYESSVKAGFTKQQAMQIVLAMLRPQPWEEPLPMPEPRQNPD